MEENEESKAKQEISKPNDIEKKQNEKKKPYKSVLLGCVFFSIFVHIGALLFLNQHFLCL